MNHAYQIAEALASRWKKTIADAPLKEFGGAGQLARHTARLHIAAMAREIAKVFREHYVDGYMEAEFYRIAFDGDERTADQIVDTEYERLRYWKPQ